MSPPFVFKPPSRVILFIEHLAPVGKSAMQMEPWWLLLSSCSSWCTRRRWWRTRPPARLCWRSRLPIQTWELMARSPTPCTVPTQTSSTSTRDQVRRCLFGVRTQARSPKRALLSADTIEAAPAQRAQNIFIISPFNFFSPPRFHLHVHHTLFLSKHLTSVLVAVIRSSSIQSSKPLKSLVFGTT